jgi:hypothetical protein
MTPPRAPRIAELLLSLFSESELLRFIRSHLPELQRDLPEGAQAFTWLAEATDRLVHLDHRLERALHAERPARAAEIAAALQRPSRQRAAPVFIAHAQGHEHVLALTRSLRVHGLQAVSADSLLPPTLGGNLFLTSLVAGLLLLLGCRPCEDSCLSYASTSAAQHDLARNREECAHLDVNGDGLACNEPGNEVGGTSESPEVSADCPTTAACGCSAHNKDACELDFCCRWVVGDGCGCR